MLVAPAAHSVADEPEWIIPVWVTMTQLLHLSRGAWRDYYRGERRGEVEVVAVPEVTGDRERLTSLWCGGSQVADAVAETSLR